MQTAFLVLSISQAQEFSVPGVSTKGGSTPILSGIPNLILSGIGKNRPISGKARKSFISLMERQGSLLQVDRG